MRLARIEDPEGGRWLARLEDGGAIPLLAEDPEPGHDPLRDALYRGLDLTGGDRRIDLDAVRLLSPVRAPSKILAIGKNYADHAAEMASEVPSRPLVFAKTPNALIGPGDPIRYHDQDTSQVDYEAELAVVIGRRASRVAPQDALEHVLGYTCCNDVTARDAQYGDGQWVRGKSFDTFCPLGPWIVTTDELGDVGRLGVRCRVDGQLLQDGSTTDLIFDVATLVSYLSTFWTLEPGDVISTGTPPGVGYARRPQMFLRHGTLVEVEVDGVGTLANPVTVT